ncbi:hypothetical protein PEBR_39547 [Penicillium brasilianum]|uniref:Uncharacterized protein n=1 Tax=Penicillium brasilianum TaxID=104259 RepID=A0A1S9R9Y8_PENBI|nr:hypothetical protein PEBR_39547 [Penicillium brasilianum]
MHLSESKVQIPTANGLSLALLAMHEKVAVGYPTRDHLGGRSHDYGHGRTRPGESIGEVLARTGKSDARKWLLGWLFSQDKSPISLGEYIFLLPEVGKQKSSDEMGGIDKSHPPSFPADDDRADKERTDLLISFVNRS